MSDITHILSKLESGDAQAASELLPLVYQELRKLAAAKMAQEQPGQTLQATALVHEAYLRLIGSQPDQPWDGRAHFFAAAAEAMRRILVDAARRRNADKRGGGLERVDLDQVDLQFSVPAKDLLEIDEAITKLSADEPLAAELVKLRYFGGFTLQDAAKHLGLSRATAFRYWAYAKSFLVCELEEAAE